MRNVERRLGLRKNSNLPAHIVSTGSKDEKLNLARKEKGTLVASGFIAGGAIMGVIAAAINFFGMKLNGEGWSLMQMLHLLLSAVITSGHSMK